jgi:hypothetical protein
MRIKRTVVRVLSQRLSQNYEGGVDWRGMNQQLQTISEPEFVNVWKNPGIDSASLYSQSSYL